MDSTEPPSVVFEAPAPCADRSKAAELLRGEAASMRAPAQGWTVASRMERDGPSRLRAVSDIKDAGGAVVAHRELAETTAQCAGLARAVAVWAGLVLEAEVERASLPASGPVPSMGAVPGAPPGGGPPPGERVAAGWPEPAAPPVVTPEHDWYLHHDDGKSLELGAGVFLMTGTGGGALAGPVVFGVFESGAGVFLRPSLAFGESLTSLPPSDVKSAMWGAARLDACLRLPGLYAKRHGMQLDLCGGADGGVTRVEVQPSTGATLPYIAVGPSIDLRGELGSRLSAVLRLVAGVQLARPSFVDLSGATEQPPLVGGRLELAFSWDAR